MGAAVGATDWVIFSDDGKERGVISCVDGVGEIVVGIFDKDGAGDVAVLYHCGHRVDDISRLLLGVEEFELVAFVGSQCVKKLLKCLGAIAVL